MAKPKLSGAQRKSLRKEIGARLSKKEEPAVIVKAISEKYKIVSFTARWYLKGVVDSRAGWKPGKKKKKPAAKIKARGPKRVKRKAGARRRKAKAVSRASSNGLLQAAIQKSIQRSREAKRLYPRLQATLGRARDLRRLEAKTGRSARAAEALAKKLEARIRQLTAR